MWVDTAAWRCVAEPRELRSPPAARGCLRRHATRGHWLHATLRDPSRSHTRHGSCSPDLAASRQRIRRSSEHCGHAGERRERGVCGVGCQRRPERAGDATRVRGGTGSAGQGQADDEVHLSRTGGGNVEGTHSAHRRRVPEQTGMCPLFARTREQSQHSRRRGHDCAPRRSHLRSSCRHPTLTEIRGRHKLAYGRQQISAGDR
mmetsp:Transcript_9970/g.23393  ORF Transcript_9970/g.23393 Transcript_9970/m.23393 type:complete len:203 (-) Transcript_9970:1225-1833(-)